jgi:hypothetical protein
MNFKGISFFLFRRRVDADDDDDDDGTERWMEEMRHSSCLNSLCFCVR